MYFDFEDYRPDVTLVGSVISWREGVLLSVIVHLVAVIMILTAPRWLPERFLNPQPRQVVVAQQEPPMQFVMVQPAVDLSALQPPPRAVPSDQNREARTPERAPTPKNAQPLSRGNTRQMIEQAQQQIARGPESPQEPSPPSPAQEPSSQEPAPSFADAPAVQLPTPAPRPSLSGRTAAPPRGSLGDSLQNLQRYVQRGQFENPQGGGGAFGPAIQFDTKGVEFGPWIRRFVAQVNRNWEPLIPLAAMSMHGHVVITFNVHKDGRLTDLAIIGPSDVQAFNTAAYGALSSSNPTVPLPPEYPTESAFFTVTFYYNEDPQ
jgi:TonB family protein